MQSHPTSNNEVAINSFILDFTGGEHEPVTEISETECLTWAMLDEQASELEMKRLEQLLLGSPAARKEYLDIVQIHFALSQMGSDPALSSQFDN